MKHLFLSATDGCYRTEHLLSLYVDGQLSPRQVQEVDSHLESCSSCKAALVILQATHQVLANRAAAKPPSYLSERLRQAIAIESTRPVVVNKKAPWFIAPPFLTGAASVAAAAIAFLVFHQSGPQIAANHKNNNPAPVTVSPLTPPKPVITAALPTPKHIHIALSRKHSELIAGLPHTPEAATSPLRLSIPGVNRIHPSELGSKIALKSTVVIAKHSVSGYATVKTAPATAHTETEPMIASAPTPAPPESVAPAAPVVPVQPTMPEQPATQITVADNEVSDAHTLLDHRLRTLALNTQTAQQSYLQPNRSELRVASYSPGLPITSSDIH